MGSCQSSPSPPSAGPVQARSAATPSASAAQKPQGTPKPKAAVSPPPQAFSQAAKVAPASSPAGEKSPVDLILELTEGRPLDASDATSLAAAKKDLRAIRRLAKEFLDVHDHRGEGEADGDHYHDHDHQDRFTLFDVQDFSSFKGEVYEKSEETRSMIYHAIRPNALFEQDSREELLQIIDAFRPRSFKEGEEVISQGDSGTDFFVVESGKLSIRVTVKGDRGEGESRLKVGDYSAGDAFGELALISGSPRAATITATADCSLWSIERTAYRASIRRLRYEQHVEKSEFLRACEAGGRKFHELFDASQVDALTIATKVDGYEEGEVILREGEVGDTFCIVRSGTVESYKGDGNGEKGAVRARESLGTEGLRGVPSPLTYRAATRVSVYYLTQQDFEDIVGPLQDALDGKAVRPSAVKKESKHMLMSLHHEERHECELEDLEVFNSLGKGEFGRARLVQDKNTKKLYALKKMRKDHIVEKGIEDRVLTAYRITREIVHPCICRVHCAMQDSRHLYILLDLMPGGVLMSHLVKRARAKTGFPEDATRFYAASVVLAYQQLHPLLIAYRNLKPENVILTADGYGVLVSFGLAKEMDSGQSYTMCGSTNDYLAPEVIRGTGHDWAVDYWGLGVFLFEMTNGTAPFYSSNQARRTRRILKGYEYVTVPSHFSSGLADLIANLLVFDQAKRLGRGRDGVQALMNHRWFAGFDWEGFQQRKLEAPIKPTVPGDLKTIGRKEEDNDAQVSDVPESEWWPELKNLPKWW